MTTLASSTPADLARLALVVAMCALLALIVRLGVERYRSDSYHDPWWGAVAMAGFVVVGIVDQLERRGDTHLSWRFYAHMIAALVGFGALWVVVRRRRDDAAA